MLKNFFNKNKNLRYDFLPSELEIIEKPASPLGKSIIYIIAVFIILMIVISCIAQIELTVVSDGRILPVEGIKTVDSNLNGKITKIYKTEGDEVQAGEEILEIENNNAENKENEIGVTLEINKLKRELLECRINDNYNEDVFNKYNINDDKKNEIKIQYNLESETNEKEIELYNNSIKNFSDTIEDLKTNVNNLQSQYNSMDENMKKGNGANVLREIEEKKSEISSNENKKKAYKNEIENKRNEKKLKYIQEKNNLDTEINKLENNLQSIKNENENYTIKSPIDGILLISNYNTVNSYINQSKAIAEIVPKDTEYEIESYIPTKDISRIEVGQEVVVKISSYDYQKYGTISGSISYISPNSFANESKGLVYKVKVKFNKDENKDIRVLPGMETTIEVKSDKIRLIEYFLEPFEKNFDNALKG